MIYQFYGSVYRPEECRTGIDSIHASNAHLAKAFEKFGCRIYICMPLFRITEGDMCGEVDARAVRMREKTVRDELAQLGFLQNRIITGVLLTDKLQGTRIDVVPENELHWYISKANGG